VAVSLSVHIGVLLALGLLVPKTRYTFIPTPPSLTFKLVRMPAASSVHAARTSGGAAAPAIASLPPSAPLRLHIPLKREPETPSRDAVAKPAEAGEGLGAPANPMRFYAGDLAGCGREDIVLMTDEEQARCRARIAAAEGRDRYPVDPAPFSGVDPAKSSAWAAQQAKDAERRDGTKAQTALKALQDARPAVEHKGTKFDITAGVRCKLVLATGKMDCHGANPWEP
jgi:hypothetical protein